MSTICFYAQFTASKAGVNSLTVTWDIERITRSDGTRSALVTGGANGVTIGRRGLYGYVLTNVDLTLYDYVATAITADTTVDQKEVAAVWTLWSLSWHDIATSVMTLAGSIGKLFTDNINATIESRSTLTAFQVWATLTSALTTPGSVGAWILDKLDVKVSSVSAGSVPTVAQIWNYAWRTLTTNHGQVVVNESTVQVNTYNSLYLPIEDLGSFANYVAIYITVKQSKKDADSQAILQARKRADGVGDGLLVALGQPATAGDGSITISDASLGNIVFAVKDTVMSQIQTGDYVADVKIIRSADVLSETLRNLKFVVTDAVTKAIS